MTIIIGNQAHTGSGGGSGGDASSSNQVAGNNILAAIRDNTATEKSIGELVEALKQLNESFGKPDVGVSASVVATSPFMSLFKAVGWANVETRDRLPPSIGEKVSSQSLSIAPATDADVATESKQDEILLALRSVAKPYKYSNVEILSVTTSSSNGDSPVQLPSMACSFLDVTNGTGVDIEYQRGSTGDYMPIPSKTSHRILNIENSSEVGFRRSDKQSSPVSITAESFVF